jgi:glycerol-3-phosphate acyltransferase PlsY
MDAMTLSLLMVFAYLMGSIPFGVIFSHLAGIKNLRQIGSGNIGATNVARAAGKKWAVITLLADIGKGIIPLWVARSLGAGQDPSAYTLSLLGFLAIVGHIFPVWLKFKGGKGVATAAGVFLYLSPLALLTGMILFVILVALTQFVSVGSLGAAASLPLWLWLFQYPFSMILLGIAAPLVFFYTHRENIRRLVKGREKPWRTPKETE